MGSREEGRGLRVSADIIDSSWPVSAEESLLGRVGSRQRGTWWVGDRWQLAVSGEIAAGVGSC